MYLSYLAFEPISLSIEYRFEDKLSIGEYDWFEVLGNRTQREAERATEWADKCVYEWVCVCVKRESESERQNVRQ